MNAITFLSVVADSSVVWVCSHSREQAQTLPELLWLSLEWCLLRVHFWTW